MKQLLVIIFIFTSSFIYCDWSFHSEDSEWNYYRELKGEKEDRHMFYNPLIETSYNKGFQIAPVSTLGSFNSTYANGINDGAPWQGRGFNGRFEAGLHYSNSWLSIDLLPEFWVAQNSDFDTMETPLSSGWGDYYKVYDQENQTYIFQPFDSLQRYGDELYYEFDFGQSHIEANYKELIELSLSTRNFSYGSAKYNPIIVSKHSKAIPNLNFGTYDKLESPIGNIEFKMTYGIMKESDFYDNGSPDENAFLSSLTLGYEPWFIPGLSLGVNTLYYRPYKNAELNDLFGPINIITSAITSGGKGGATGAHSGSDDTDQFASVVADWKAPGTNFHIFMEWGRNDFNGGLENMLTTPEHSQAFSIGASYLLEYGIGDFLLSVEFTELKQERDHVYRPAGPWYRHGWGESWHQGFVNNGQIMGAPIGPGSNSQTVEVTYFKNRQKYSLIFNRTLFDNDYYYNVYVPIVGLDDKSEGGNWFNSSLYAHRWKMSLMLNSTIIFNNFDLYAGAEVAHYYNFNYIPDNDKWNFYGQLGIRYYPGAKNEESLK